MVIYANTCHNLAEEVQLTPIEGSCTSQGFYGTDTISLHLRTCGFPYKLALEKAKVAISPQTTCIRITLGCLLNAVSYGRPIKIRSPLSGPENMHFNKLPSPPPQAD